MTVGKVKAQFTCHSV